MKITYKNFNPFLKNVFNFLIHKKYTSAYIYHLILNQSIQINGQVVMHRYQKIKLFDQIEITLLLENNNLNFSSQPIDIIYEDDYILIVNKKKGEEIEPVIHHYQDTLANKITFYYQQQKIASKIHFINRLDKMTAGIVVLAKNAYIHHLFSFVKMKKMYTASVKGKTLKRQTIQCFIQKSEDGVKRIVDKKGKLSITKIFRISYKNGVSQIRIRLLTGRTHQIRVSLNYINHPLLGDVLYNDEATSYDCFDLKASSITFKHPILKKRISIKIIDK